MSAEPGPVRRVLGWLTVAALAVPVLCLVPLAGAGSLLVGLCAMLAVAAAVLPWPVGRVGLVAAALSASVGSLAVDVGYGGTLPVAALWIPVELTALLVLLGLVLRRAAARPAAWLAPLLAVTAAVLPLRYTMRVDSTSPLASVLSVAVAWFAVMCAAGVGFYLRLADDRRARAARRARHAQRLDLAHDLHDFVAHELTGIVLAAQAAQLDRPDPAPTTELYGRIERAGVRALESLDRAVHALRDPDEPARLGASTRPQGVGDLPELVARFSGAGRVRATQSVAPELVGTLPAELDATAYRIVVEALTNVRRHAPDATRVEVTVAAPRTGAGVTVTVVDDGAGALPDRPHRPDGGAIERQAGGTGLAGLTERVAALGGTIHAGRHGTGWRLSATLPTGTAADRAR